MSYDEAVGAPLLALEVHAELVPLEAHAVRLARRVGRVAPVEVADARFQAPPVAADLDVVDAAVAVEEVVELALLDVVGQPFHEDAPVRRPAAARPVVVVAAAAALVRRRPRPRDVAPHDPPVQFPTVHAQRAGLGLRLLLEGDKTKPAGPSIIIGGHVDVSYFP